jgi:hypothetical protein
MNKKADTGVGVFTPTIVLVTNPIIMKIHTILVQALLCIVLSTANAQEIEKFLEPFNRIVASPRINLVLKQGNKEEIRLTYSNVSESDINIVVHGNTLRIYLDGSRVTEKQERIARRHKRGAYIDAIVTAYVTFTNLEHLEIRGNQELTCEDTIESEKFKLKAYGENQIMLASVKSEYMKTQLYGENTLRIKSGKADYQKYKLYGENRIDTRGLKSFATSATIYGESKVKLNSQDALRVNAFGEADVAFLGNADVSKGWIFGRTNIHRIVD